MLYTIVNALVISAMLPCSVVMDGSLSPAYAATAESSTRQVPDIPLDKTETVNQGQAEEILPVPADDVIPVPGITLSPEQRTRLLRFLTHRETEAANLLRNILNAASVDGESPERRIPSVKEMRECFETVNSSSASEEMDQSLNDFVWAVSKRLVPENELVELAKSIPAYGGCANHKSVYWRIAVNQITGHALAASGRDEEALGLLDSVRKEAERVMGEDRIAGSDYLLFVPGHYLLACRDLGREALDAGMARLHRVAEDARDNKRLRFAAQHALASTYNREYNDIIEGGMQVANMVDENPREAFDAELGNEREPKYIKAHSAFMMGYARYQMAHFGTAREYFNRIEVLDSKNRRLSDAAGYMAAYMTELADQDDANTVLRAYGNYVNRFPSGEFRDRTLLNVAAVFERRNELSAAAAGFRKALELFPDASWNKKIQEHVKDLENSIKAGMEKQLELDALVAKYGSSWCGPYALALLLESQGKAPDIAVLAEQAGLDSTGVSLSGLLKAAEAAGVPLYAVQTSSMAEVPVPAVAHLNGNHFVFVSAVSPTGVTAEDLFGPGTPAPDMFDKQFSGYALCLAPPDKDKTVDPAVLDSVRGGSDGFYSDLDESYMHCINQDHITDCLDNGEPASGGGAGRNPTASPNSKGTYPPGDIHEVAHVNLPGAMSDPGHPSIQPNIPFGGSTMTIGMGTNHRAITITQTDIAIPTRSTMDLAFTRVYYNPWGSHRNYESVEDRPYKNNIGSGWRHNFNVHVRVSSENGYIGYADANGNFKRFSRTQSNVNGYDLYRRAPEDMTGADINALRTERAILARRNVQSGAVEIIFPDGITCGFSAPINEQERYCRLEWFEDVSGNRITLQYADCLAPTPVTGDPGRQTNFGRLIRVNTPAGDDRYLKFTYTGNRISRVELCKTGDVVIKAVDYTYDTYHTLNPGETSPYPNNFLRSVVSDGNFDAKVAYEYDDGSYNGQDVGLYPSKIRDRKGNELNINCTYGTIGTDTFISAITTEILYPNGLKTVFTKVTPQRTEIKNFDGTTCLSRFVYEMDIHRVRVDNAKYYNPPDGDTYTNWSYSYQNNYDLVSIPNAGVTYEYNADGRAVKYTCGGVVYRYEYEPGVLYPKKMYGPGTTADFGPCTTYNYDIKNRLTSIKPPHMGASGITIEYDQYGKVIKRTNAAGNTQIYTYDTRGNLIQHKDYNAAQWIYTYDDLGRVLTQKDPNNQVTTYTYAGGCASCGGMSGLVASISLPDNRQVLFEYDNNGNLKRQTDPMGHETFYEYDAMDNQKKVISSEGRVQTFEYDKLGNLEKQTNFDNVTTRYAYDYRGLLTRVWMPLGNDLEDTLAVNEYDYHGWLTKTTDGKGQDTLYAYNNRGQVCRVSRGAWCTLGGTCDFGPIHVWYDYNSRGLVYRARAEKRDSTGTNLIYEPITYYHTQTTGLLYQKKTMNDGIERTVTYTYDDTGKLLKMDDWADGPGHGFAYDANGRLATYTDYDGKTMQYTYDALGRPTGMAAYEPGNDYNYEYDASGQMSVLRVPGNKQWGFSYDAVGRLTAYTWPNGMRTEYNYDRDGRLTRIENKNGTIVVGGWQYQLSGEGQVLNMVDIRENNQEGWEYEYDRRGRVIRALRRYNTGVPRLSMHYTYDKADNMLSQTQYNYTGCVIDGFADNNYSSNPAWTVASGSWSALNGLLKPAQPGQAGSIYTPNTYSDCDVWWSFKPGTGTWKMMLRYKDDNNFLCAEWGLGVLQIAERVNGQNTSLTMPGIPLNDTSVWYIVYVRLDGSSMTVYTGKRGQAPQRWTSVTTSMPGETTRLQIQTSSTATSEFDDIQLCSRATHSGNTMALTYNYANQVVSKISGNITTNFSYDAWGRLVKRDANVNGQDYSATFQYTCGDKLAKVTSTFPNETPVCEYDYDGLGKRRKKMVGDTTLYWRWDEGYSMLTQYEDQSPDWGVGAFKRSFVPFGYTALAEGDMDASGNPVTAALTYLAHDHMGNSRYGYNEARGVVATTEHLPSGQRLGYTGTVPFHEFAGANFDPESKQYFSGNGFYFPGVASGILSNNMLHCEGAWSTVDFIMHYYTGRGRTVYLANVGLLDRYKKDPFVERFVSNYKQQIRMLARRRARKLSKDCICKTHVSGRMTYVNDAYTNFTWDPCLHVLGNGELYGTGSCGISVYCPTKRYNYSCGMSFHQNDSFQDPIDLGVELGLISRPYDILAYWQDTVGGGGQL